MSLIYEDSATIKQPGILVIRIHGHVCLLIKHSDRTIKWSRSTIHMYIISQAQLQFAMCKCGSCVIDIERCTHPLGHSTRLYCHRVTHIQHIHSLNTYSIPNNRDTVCDNVMSSLKYLCLNVKQHFRNAARSFDAFVTATLSRECDNHTKDLRISFMHV